MRDYYQPHRRPVREALSEAGVDPADISAIVNCHMHWDHAGGNYEFPGIPIYVQEAELEAAREVDFTLPEYTFDFPDARLRPIDGEHELLPGVRIVPTPGHTPGHQSLLIEADRRHVHARRPGIRHGGGVQRAGARARASRSHRARASAAIPNGYRVSAIGTSSGRSSPTTCSFGNPATRT